MGDAQSVPASLIGTPQHFRWLRGIALTVFVLNLLDAVFTIGWIMSGLATEANPLLSDLVERQPALFILFKAALVGMGLWVLWRYRQRRMAVVAIFVAFLTYYLLLLYHLHALQIGLLNHVL